MAQEDLEKYFQVKEKNAILHKKLAIIMKEVADGDYNELWKIKSVAQDLMKSLDENLANLEKHSLCAHTNIRNHEYTGNDSLNDYYKDYCLDCGKTIREY